MWKCRCQCGFTKDVEQNSLTDKRSTGCRACRPKKHGLSRTKEYRMLMQAQKRAKRAGKVFKLTVTDICIPKRCPLLDIPLVMNTHRRFHANNPSLDQINPSKGYIPGNVWVISWRANVIKHNASLKELKRLVRNLELKV